VVRSGRAWGSEKPTTPKETEMANLSPIDVQRYLKGADYPMSKDDVVNLAQSNDAPSDIVDALRSMSKDSFDGPNAVTSALKDAGELSGS
jgi:hypothetical protein